FSPHSSCLRLEMAYGAPSFFVPVLRWICTRRKTSPFFFATAWAKGGTMSVHTFLRSRFVGLTLGITRLVSLHYALTLPLALAPTPTGYADQGCEFPDEPDSDEPDG